MSIIQGTSKAAGGGYTIDQSIRFDKTTSSHLSKTYGSAGNRRTWTFSTWFKRGKIDGTRQILFAATGTAYLQVGPDAASREMITILNEGSGTDLNWYTTQVFRDPSAWYHLVWQFDSTQATADDRTKLYINGVQVIDFTKAATPDLNLEGAISNAVEHKIGEGHTAANYFDGYQAEIHFIDGTALDATSFGETNDDGVWVPIEYTGSYGTNGFHITGETASDLGEDFSGNNNDFTSSGLATTDQMLDTPTDNFCTLSSIDKYSSVTLSNGNLVGTSASGWHHGRGTHFVSSGKWYYEWTSTSGSYAEAGWMTDVAGNDHVEEESDPDTTYYRGIGAAGRGVVIGDGSPDTGPPNFNTDDIIMMAIDIDTMEFWVGVNGTWYNSGDPANGTNATGTWTARLGYSLAPWYGLFIGSSTFNFGQSSFSYTIPTGFNPWSTAGLPDPTIADPSAHFNPVLFTGNSGTAFSVTGVGFQPDFVWGKPRSYTDNHRVMDVVRGSTKQLITNTTSAEFTQAQGITSFDSDGFTVGTHNGLNTGTNTYVAWCWLADNTTGSSNTDGTVSSTVSANTTAGFSIAKWTHTTASNYTVGHGLGAVPKMILVKTTDQGTNWGVYHSDITVGNRLILNSSSAQTTGYWGANSWTSSTFSIGSARDANGSTAVAYCFAEVDGFSKMGSYTGNGSTDGPFVYTGMTPEFVIIKRTNTTENWIMLDNARSEYNVTDDVQYSNLAQADGTNSATTRVDNVSNGFKVRGTNTNINASGSTYIYMAFASSPFKTATAR